MTTRIYSVLLTAAVSLFSYGSIAQNAAINEDGSAPNANAILDIKSFTKGVLLPRVSTAGRLAIPNTKGLLVYDTTTSSYWFNTGAAWQNLSQAAASTGATGWLLTGNSGTDSSSFIGTTDLKPFVIKAGNVISGRIDPRFTGNTFWGYNTAPSLKQDSALYNTGVGGFSMTALTTGIANTAIGALSLTNNTSGSYNTASGEGVLWANTTGSNNTAAGFQSMDLNTTGSNNSAFGGNALKTNSTGFENSAFGRNSLQRNTTGADNAAFGFNALDSNTTGSSNTAAGTGALWFNNTGSANTALGGFSLSGNTTGASNTASGFQSLVFNFTGNANTGIGAYAAFHMETGSSNTAVGEQALYNNVTGIFNTAIGQEAGYFFDGNNNTSIGAGSNCFGATNCTAIGYNAFANVSNKVRIGNSAVTVIEGQVPFTTPSDGRYKFQVQEDVKGLDFIMQLRPVTYQFDVRRFDTHVRQGLNGKTSGTGNNAMEAAYTEATAIRRSGFIAQEVEKAADASGYNFSGIIKPKTEQDHYSLSYEAFVVPLVKGMQEQQRIIDAQNKKLEAQATVLAGLQRQLDEMKQLLQRSK